MQVVGLCLKVRNRVKSLVIQEELAVKSLLLLVEEDLVELAQTFK